MSQKIRETRLVPFDMQSGDGYPDHISRLGSFYFDNLTGIQYQNKNGISNWSQFFDGDNRPIDIYVTGGTYDYTSGIATFVNNSGGTFTLSGFNIGGGGSFSGGTVINGADFLAGLTSTTITTNSISATTYYNLPIDLYVTGGTYNNGSATFINNTGGTFSVTGFSTSTTAEFTGGTVTGSTNFTDGLTANTISATTYLGLPTDVFVTGATYTTGTAIFTNNTGGTFSVTGFSTSTAAEFTGGTVTGSTNFTGGLTASTISATTYYGDGSNLTGINTATPPSVNLFNYYNFI